MAEYSISLLELEDCPLQVTADKLLILLKAWRKKRTFSHVCSECHNPIKFESMAYALCCQQFYYDDRIKCYPVLSIAVPTPGYTFVLPQLQRMIQKKNIQTNQEFLVLPDPIYWQVPSTLVYEKVLKFVLGRPMTNRTNNIQPASKAPHFYKQVQEAPLNYGSLESRSCGKATLIRQVAYGKRCKYSMRGMIVPEASIAPNQICLPDYIINKFGLRGKWIILNRMPSLQPENFVALQVPAEPPSWPHDCFGIPLEILESINGDFDGDEANIYLVPSLLSQAECATLLNPEWEMGCFVMGLKLNPSQDMLVAYHLFRDTIDFLPYKHPDLKKTFRVIYELYGSKRCYDCVDAMRKFYLDKLQNEVCFALTLEEMLNVESTIRMGGDVKSVPGCLNTQILAGAKGNFDCLIQMFGPVGMQDGVFIKSSFWKGLKGKEASAHGNVSLRAMYTMQNIWFQGYVYNKIMSNAHDMKVDYGGRLMDGQKRIVLKDALDAYHYTDALSEELFDYIRDRVLVERNFELL